MLRWLAIILGCFVFVLLFYIGVFIYYRIKASRIPPEQLLLEGMDKEQPISRPNS